MFASEPARFSLSANNLAKSFISLRILSLSPGEEAIPISNVEWSFACLFNVFLLPLPLCLSLAQTFSDH